jgi:hypothetical protein
LSDSETGVSSAFAASEVEANGLEAELRDAEAQADAGVGAVQELIIIDDDVTERIDERLP